MGFYNGVFIPDDVRDEEAPGGVVINPHSPMGKELRKWEQHVGTQFTPFGTTPGNPYVFRPYPKMLYKAQKQTHTGKVFCMMPPPDITEFDNTALYERACLQVDSFNKRCYIIVHDDEGERRATNDGWRETPSAAMEMHEALEQAISTAAAEANFAVQHMSQRAKDELKVAGDSTHQHVTDVTGVPVAASASERKRGAKGVVADPSLD